VSRIDITKPYALRDGRPCEVMGVLNATDDTRALMVVKAKDANGVEQVSTRFLNGRMFAATETPDDVVNVIPRIREKFFVLRNKRSPSDPVTYFWSRPDDILLANWDVIATFRIDIAEGDGL
jgi:hypothetical protein